MNNLPYIRFVWKTHRGLAFFSMIFIILFQAMIMYFITTFDTTSIVGALISQLPQKMRIFLSESFFNLLNLDGAAAFGFNHPFVLAIMSLIGIVIPVHHISGELKSGSLELLLSQPISRNSLLFNLWISVILILFFVSAASFAGTILTIYIFHKLTFEVMLKVAGICLNLWLLFILISSYTLLVTTIRKLTPFAGNIGAGITLFFSLLYFFSELIDWLKFTKPLNFFNYYQPRKIMFEQGNLMLDCTILAISAIVCFAAASIVFKKRDIP